MQQLVTTRLVSRLLISPPSPTLRILAAFLALSHRRLRRCTAKRAPRVKRNRCRVRRLATRARYAVQSPPLPTSFRDALRRLVRSLHLAANRAGNCWIAISPRANRSPTFVLCSLFVLRSFSFQPALRCRYLLKRHWRHHLHKLRQGSRPGLARYRHTHRLPGRLSNFAAFSLRWHVDVSIARRVRRRPTSVSRRARHAPPVSRQIFRVKSAARSALYVLVASFFVVLLFSRRCPVV